jgi:2-succinyl-6-hydroxy-2,4-cyclohexadiene-1-carboxylate synthase
VTSGNVERVGLKGILHDGRPGDPLLLLHGFTGSPTSWAAVVERLPATWTVLRPWLPGHGPGGWPVALADFDEVVDALAAAAANVAAGPWHVAGYSLGGRLALRLAIRHPGLVGRLVSIGARPGLRTETERAARGDSDGRLAAILREQGIGAFVAAWEGLPLFRTQSRLGPELLAAQRAARLAHSAEGLARALEVLGAAAMPDCWPALPSLPMPVDLVAGELDESYRAVTVAMASSIPTARVTIVPGCGHNVVLECPEAVVGVLAERSGEGES